MLAIGAAWLISGFENTGIATSGASWISRPSSAECRRGVASFIGTMIAVLALRS